MSDMMRQASLGAEMATEELGLDKPRVGGRCESHTGIIGREIGSRFCLSGKPEGIRHSR